MKKIIRGLIIGIVFIPIFPLGVIAKLCYWLFKSQIMFAIFAEILSLIPNLPGSFCRMVYYKMTLDKSHLNIYFAFGAIVTKMQTRLGYFSGVGGRTTIGLADVGDYTIVSNNVSVLSGGRQHNFDNPDEGVIGDDDNYQRIKIGSHSFIGERAIVMADVGDRTIIGAGAVVVKNIPSYSIAVGNPAKVVKERKSEGEIL